MKFLPDRQYRDKVVVSIKFYSKKIKVPEKFNDVILAPLLIQFILDSSELNIYQLEVLEQGLKVLFD